MDFEHTWRPKLHVFQVMLARALPTIWTSGSSCPTLTPSCRCLEASPRPQCSPPPLQTAPNYERLNARNDYRGTRLATQQTRAPSEQVRWTTSVFFAEKNWSHAMAFRLLDQRTYDAGVDSRAVIDFGSEHLQRRLVLGGSVAHQHGDELRHANVEGRGHQHRSYTIGGTTGQCLRRVFRRYYPSPYAAGWCASDAG